MKKDYTHITVVLDRSGSMNSIANDTIGGFNKFLDDQKKEAGSATLTLVGFDDKYELWEDFKNIQNVEPLTDQKYVPRGTTALIDASMKAIVSTGERLNKLNEVDKPEMVIFVIITDGYENASREWTKAKLAETIKEQTDKWKWQFVFLGANIDSFGEASNLNINQAAAMNYVGSPIGTQNMYTSLSNKMSSTRGKLIGAFSFDDNDHDAQKGV